VIAAPQAMSVVIWSSANINYMYILELDPYNHISYVRIFHLSAVCFMILSISFFFYLCDIGKIFQLENVFHFWHHGLWHLLLFTVAFLLCVCPFNIFHYPTRHDLGCTLLKVFSAPFIKPTFRQTFVADILTSMPKVLADIEYAFCHYLSGDFMDHVGIPQQSCKPFNTLASNVLHFVPYGIRLLQCLRMFYETSDVTNLFNAGKYTSCVFSTAISVYYSKLDATDPSKHLFFQLMITSATATAVYAYWWDIHKDWGLGHWRHGLLRPQLMFKKRRWVYYWAMGSDLALRFGWMVTTLIPFSAFGAVISFEVTLLFEALELFRRAQWGIFRLENEQLHKVGISTVESVVMGLDLDEAEQAEHPNDASDLKAIPIMPQRQRSASYSGFLSSPEFEHHKPTRQSMPAGGEDRRWSIPMDSAGNGMIHSPDDAGLMSSRSDPASTRSAHSQPLLSDGERSPHSPRSGLAARKTPLRSNTPSESQEAAPSAASLGSTFSNALTNPLGLVRMFSPTTDPPPRRGTGGSAHSTAPPKESDDVHEDLFHGVGLPEHFEAHLAKTSFAAHDSDNDSM